MYKVITYISIYILTKVSGRGFKSQSSQLSLATSKNPTVVNTMYISSFCYTHKITTYVRFRFKKPCQLTTAIAEMKFKH